MAYIRKGKVLSRIRKLCEIRSEPPMSRDDMIELKLLQKLEKEFSELSSDDTREFKSCDKCLFLDVPAGHMPCIECSNYYVSQFKEK